MKRYVILMFLVCTVMLVAGDVPVDISTPRATFDTFINAALNKDKDLCVYCAAQPLKREIADEWEDMEVPEELDYEIIDEEIKGNIARLTVEARIVMEGDEERATEDFWLIKEEDGWKICDGPPDEFEESDSTIE